jgi:hypothetical protein
LMYTIFIDSQIVFNIEKLTNTIYKPITIIHLTNAPIHIK